MNPVGNNSLIVDTKNLEQKQTGNFSSHKVIAIASDLPHELIIKIISFLHYKEYIQFSQINKPIYTIMCQNKLRSFDIVIESIKNDDVKLKLQEIVVNFRININELLFVIYKKEFKIIDLLSSCLNSEELELLNSQLQCMECLKLIEKIKLMRGLKRNLCLFANEPRRRNESISLFLLEACKCFSVADVERLIRWYLNICGKINQYHTQKRTSQCFPASLLKKMDSEYFTGLANQNLYEMFSALLDKGQIAFVANLFERMGALLLEHPSLNDVDIEYGPTSLPMLVVFLIPQAKGNGFYDKIIAFINTHPLAPTTRDIFVVAILAHWLDRCLTEFNGDKLGKKIYDFFKRVKLLELNCDKIRNRMVGHLVTNFLLSLEVDVAGVYYAQFRLSQMSENVRKKLLNEASNLVNTINEPYLRKDVDHELSKYK